METQRKTQLQMYTEIISNLNEEAFELMAVSLWPNEMKVLLLSAPHILQKVLVELALSDTKVIDSLSNDSLENIGSVILAEEMKGLLLCAPLDVKKQLVDEHFEEQERINKL